MLREGITQESKLSGVNKQKGLCTCRRKINQNKSKHILIPKHERETINENCCENPSKADCVEDRSSLNEQQMQIYLWLWNSKET